MLDLSQTGLIAFLKWPQYVLILCIVVILVAYWMYRKKQV